MLRVLFVSRNNKTTKFVSWATKILFAVQLGSIEQKNELVSNIKGVSYETIQELKFIKNIYENIGMKYSNA